MVSTAASTTGAPNSANSRDSRRSPRCAAPTIAARSPRNSRGLRMFNAQQIEQIIAQPSRFVELDRGNTQSLLPDLGRAGIIAAMRGASDVALVRANDGPE